MNETTPRNADVKDPTVFEMMTRFFDRIYKNEKAQTELKRYDKTVQFHVSDGREVYATIKDGNVSVAYGQLKTPDLEMRASTETYQKILGGKVSPGKAWWDKTLWLGSDGMGWTDTSVPDYPWLTRMFHWFAPGTDK